MQRPSRVTSHGWGYVCASEVQPVQRSSHAWLGQMLIDFRLFVLLHLQPASSLAPYQKKVITARGEGVDQALETLLTEMVQAALG